MKRVHLFISGRVQGVFFRAFTVEKAKELGLVGFVRNLSDGRVEVVAEGPEDKLKEMINYLWTGPEAAYVEHLDIKWEKATGEFKDFERKPTI